MSEDFFDAGVTPTATGESSGPQGIPDMDALFEQAVNQDDVRQTQSDSLKPVGTYRTVPVLNLDAKRAEIGKGSVSPVKAKDRLVFRFFGPAVMTVTEKNAKQTGLAVGTEVRGQFGFAISPERCNKLDYKTGQDSGAPDGASQRWAQAVKAYEVAYKAKPSTMGDVVRYVQNYPIQIRVIQVGVPTENNPEPDGEPGNIVMNLSAVRDAS